MADAKGDEGQVDDGDDPLREILLEAAARVFAAKGYSGTRVQDIVREAGLSTGAMYGRFESKRELLTEAVVTNVVKVLGRQADDQRVADVIAEFARRNLGPLSDSEALQLEAYVTARREPEVVDAITEARRRRRGALKPFLKQAVDDGSLSPDADVEAMLFFLDTVSLGLLLQRAAGVTPPGPERWDTLVREVLRVISRPSERRPTKRPAKS